MIYFTFQKIELKYFILSISYTTAYVNQPSIHLSYDIQHTALINRLQYHVLANRFRIQITPLWYLNNIYLFCVNKKPQNVYFRTYAVLTLIEPYPGKIHLHLMMPFVLPAKEIPHSKSDNGIFVFWNDVIIPVLSNITIHQYPERNTTEKRNFHVNSHHQPGTFNYIHEQILCF